MRSGTGQTATRRQHRLLFTRWFLFTFALWCLLAANALYSAKQEIDAGGVSLRSLSDMSDPMDLDFDEVSQALVDGEQSLNAAKGHLGSSILYPMRVMPVLGRQLESSQALVRVALDVTISVQPLVENLRASRSSPDLDRVAFLQRLEAQLGEVSSVARTADLGPSDGLFGPLFDGRSEMESQLAELTDRAGSYQAVSAGLASFLSEGTYLVLGANNAEMRLGSGMHLSVGRMQNMDGTVELLDLTHAQLLAPVGGARVLDQDVSDRWGFLNLENDFRKLGYSARFDEHVGPQALELWRAKTGETLDGVVLLDPFVLEAIAGVLGPVSVDGEEYDSENVLHYLLKGQYESVEVWERDNDTRRDHLARLASELSTLFRAGSWDPLDMVEALGSVANGRHLMIYSEGRVEQDAWNELGVSGSLNGSETGIFWLNTGASKLDPFLDVSIVVRTSVVDDRRLIEMEMSTKNRGDSSLPIYTIGPWESLGIPSAGTYQGRLAAYAPNDVQDAHFVPDRRLEVVGPDGYLWVLGTESLRISPGQTQTTTFSYTVDAERGSIDILPSGRFPSIKWSWDGYEFDDSERRTVQLTE